MSLRADLVLVFALVVASASACGLDDHGEAANASGGASGGVVSKGGGGNANGGFPSGGAASGGSASGGTNSGGVGGSAGSPGGGAQNGGAAGTTGATGGVAGQAAGGVAGATGGAAGAVSNGGSGGTSEIDCETKFGGMFAVQLCSEPPAGQCTVAFGGAMGLVQSCDAVCAAAGTICVQALDDDADQTCVLPVTVVSIGCSYTPNKSVCFCA